MKPNGIRQHRDKAKCKRQQAVLDEQVPPPEESEPCLECGKMFSTAGLSNYIRAAHAATHRANVGVRHQELAEVTEYTVSKLDSFRGEVPQ